MNFEKGPVRTVIDSLSELIIDNLKGAAREQYFPCSDPDDMDKRIREGILYAKRLRDIREQFENCASGILL